MGIIFTIGATVFGFYKLLLRHGDDRSNRTLPSYPSLSTMQHSRYVKHSISKHSIAEQNVETCAWLNTIAASLCVEALSSPVLVESLHKKLHEILNKPEDKPDVLGKIIVSDINMGTGLPLIDGIRVLSRPHDDGLNAEVVLRYNGGASFTISTELWMNWPTPKFASLPVSLHASFDHFEGTLTAKCHWTNNKTRVILYFATAPAFQLRIGSTIGHTTKLVNVLQVSNMLENMIYSFVNKELVAPSGFELELESGKLVSARKLGSTPKITEKGEGKGKDKGGMIKGDLSHRSFSASSES